MCNFKEPKISCRSPAKLPCTSMTLPLIHLDLLQEAAVTGFLCLLGRVSLSTSFHLAGTYLLRDEIPLLDEMQESWGSEDHPTMPHLLTESLSPKCLRVRMSWCQNWKTWGLAGSPSGLVFPLLPAGFPTGLESTALPQLSRDLFSSVALVPVCERGCCFLSQHPVGRALKWPNSLLFPLQHASVTWLLIQPLPYGSPTGSEIPEFP